MTSNILEGLRPLAVPVERVKLMKGNPRRGDVDAVARSLKRLGQHRPIVVQRETGEILAGNHTYRAALQLGWTEIAVLFTDDDRETAVARSLADNRTSDEGTYDNAELAELMSELADFDDSLLVDAGFHGDEIEALLALATAHDDLTLEEARKAEPSPDLKEGETSEDDDEVEEASSIEVEEVAPRARKVSEVGPTYDGEAGWSSLFIGNCLDVLADFPDASIDSVVTDPLGGITTERLREEDLGDGWWRWVPGPVFWKEISRVMKPGAHIAVMAGSATWHKVAICMEDAGLEMRDTLMWLFRHGMPMGMDIGQKIEKLHGHEADPYFKKLSAMTDAQRVAFVQEQAEAGNPWFGWSTGLKPAFKPILLFRKKPFGGSAAKSVDRYGTGAINIDDTRVGNEERAATATWRDTKGSKDKGHGYEIMKKSVQVGSTSLGRWPSNVVADQEVHVDLGDSSRYFLCAGAPKAEKNDGLPPGEKNDHPKPRPVDLGRYLVTLITPPGGVVLDPFCGSGSFGVAATDLGFGFVGIDRTERWIDPIAKHRLAAVRARRAQAARAKSK